MTPVLSTIITGVITVIVGLLTLFGVIYQSNKQFDNQKVQLDTSHKLLEQKFEDYKDYLYQLNSGLKEDIEKLSIRVDEHNNYGIKIPVMEKEIDNLKARVSNLEDK